MRRTRRIRSNRQRSWTLSDLRTLQIRRSPPGNSRSSMMSPATQVNAAMELVPGTEVIKMNANTARDRLEILYGSVERALSDGRYIHPLNSDSCGVSVMITPEGHLVQLNPRS